MKIAVASDEGISIASHFGRTRGFVIYEMENDRPVHRGYRVNDFTGHARGLEGAGHDHDRHGPILAALADCDVVISHGMGHRIYADLMQAGKSVFITGEIDVEQAVGAFASGHLVHNPDLTCHHPHDRH